MFVSCCMYVRLSVPMLRVVWVFVHEARNVIMCVYFLSEISSILWMIFFTAKDVFCLKSFREFNCREVFTKGDNNLFLFNGPLASIKYSS